VKGDAYIPVYNEEIDSWYPCNRPAELLVHLSHIWKDIQTLNELRLKQPPESEVLDKLLFKHIIIEFVSLLDSLREIQGIVMKSPRLIKEKPAPWRYITKREFLEGKRLFKELWRELEPVEKQLLEIRNQIGAHRELSDLSSVRLLWEKLDAAKYVDAMNTFPPLFKYLNELNIYEWSRSLGEKDGNIMMSVFGSRIVHDWEDAFDSENETI
jgi:hypothetical protein